MPLKLKRWKSKGPNWYIRGTVNGFRILESTGTSDRTEADKRRAKRELELLESRPVEREGPLTFVGAVDIYIDAGGEARYALKLLDHFKSTPVEKIGQDELNKAARILYPKGSRATRLRSVFKPAKAIFNAAADADKMPYRKIKTPQVKDPVVKPASDPHIEAVTANIKARSKPFIIIVTENGPRTSELLSLHWDNTNLQAAEGILENSKNGEPFILALSERAVAALANLPNKEGRVFPFSKHTLYKDVKDAEKKAGLTEHKTIHQMGRHAFAARLLAAGHTIKLVKEAGNWKDIRIVDQKYGFMERDHVHKIVRKVAKSVK